jgi:hypothetical protein
MICNQSFEKRHRFHKPALAVEFHGVLPCWIFLRGFLWLLGFVTLRHTTARNDDNEKRS